MKHFSPYILFETHSLKPKKTKINRPRKESKRKGK